MTSITNVCYTYRAVLRGRRCATGTGAWQALDYHVDVW